MARVKQKVAAQELQLQARQLLQIWQVYFVYTTHIISHYFWRTHAWSVYHLD